MHRAAANAAPACALWYTGIAVAISGTLLAQTPTQFVVRTPAGVATGMLGEAVAADFDGDGDLDLCGGALPFMLPPHRMLRNDGSERFTDVTATHLPVSTSPTQITVAFDMDGDGDLDLFVGKLGPSRLWRNTGLGVFVDASAGLPATAANHSDVVAADFDGDGDVDLAAAGSTLIGSQNRLFLNNGSGVFADLNVFPGNVSISIAATDFDGDGDQDLALATYFAPILFRNDGNLVFTDVSAQWLPALGTTLSREVAAADLDGDGDPDLVVARGNAGPTDVLRNTGSAFVLAGTLSPAGTMALAIADCDEDGDLDIFRSVYSAPLALAVNDGSGTFTATPSRLPSLVSNANPGLFVCADFDRDGDHDLLISEPTVPASMLVNRHRDLNPGPATIGQTWTIDVWSTPGYATLHHTSLLAIGLARMPQPLQVPVLGELWLDLGAPYVVDGGIVFAHTGTHQFSYPVPPLPQLIGVELHVQGLIEQAPGPARFTAYRSLIVQ